MNKLLQLLATGKGKFIAGGMIALTVLIAIWYYGHTRYTYGVTITEAKYDKQIADFTLKQNKLIAESDKKINKAYSDRDRYQSMLEEQADAFDQELLAAKQAGQKKLDDYIAGVNNGSIRLHDHGDRSSAHSSGNTNGTVCETPATTHGTQTTETGQLSDEASQFLLRLAAEADQVVKERNNLSVRYQSARQSLSIVQQALDESLTQGTISDKTLTALKANNLID